jgi:uncharacterized protein YcnI
MSRTATALPRVARRVGIAGAVLVATIVATATPAFAHVEVEADKAQALAENVTISFDAESESNTLGITALRVVLPEGIDPTDVSYAEGPKGWKLTASDDGYTVKGPAVTPGKNAVYSVTVRQLPDEDELVFKTLQTYSDGRVDRWIEVPQDGAAEPESPAPVLKLTAAKDGAASVSSSPSESAAATPSTDDVSGTEPSAAPAAAATQEDSGLSAGAWVGIAAGLAVLAAAGVYVLRRKPGGSE